MVRLEDLAAKQRLRGVSPAGTVTLLDVQPLGPACVQIAYRDGDGRLAERPLYREDEALLTVETGERKFSVDGDLARLLAEAFRIRHAWHFDPYVAVNASVVEPLPHQISAVYEEMLPRQPLRFLLADDPGAGKTIMAGLLIKELMVRGDLRRCLIVAPGSLVEQWQDELQDKFSLSFEIFTAAEKSRRNPFSSDLLIARLDQLSRNAGYAELLQDAPEWDLIVCDEAHRMSAHYAGGERKETKRFALGRKLGDRCRHFLLMTATPHNGKEEDFQLFLTLLDPDRFEGRYRADAHGGVHASDLMRRLIKEDLYTFNGAKLFPERFSYTASYTLSPPEAALYDAVTDYVRNEMARAKHLPGEEKQRTLNVGFALMILQRRLASSPEAIWKSLERRYEKLHTLLAEQRQELRGRETTTLRYRGPSLSEDELSALDEEAPEDEREETEQRLVDHASAARTLAELEKEVERLAQLKQMAAAVRQSHHDAKWQQLLTVLGHPLMIDAQGKRRKLVIFTEFRDTLTYLAGRIRTWLGQAEGVAEIHGGVDRNRRRQIVEDFRQRDDAPLVLIANDAAGEGVNLQSAHLMVNYDLPWNPNRLEQRFGRIHRIGQSEVCHLWNLLADKTREADVYELLLRKLEEARKALDGKVFDVIGRLFQDRPLRDLLQEAILYGDDPNVKQRLQRVVAHAVDHEHVQSVIEQYALASDTMNLSQVERIRADMERARARRLQPHFLRNFFLAAFNQVGGTTHEREPQRWEVSSVPNEVRARMRRHPQGPGASRYARVCFEKAYVAGSKTAELLCLGQPLLDATVDLLLDRHKHVLREGSVLVDESDESERLRLLVLVRHAVHHDCPDAKGDRGVISERIGFVEGLEDGSFHDSGPAPHLDYRGASEAEREGLASVLSAAWLQTAWEPAALAFVAHQLVPQHLEEIRRSRLVRLDKVQQQVNERLQKEANYWDSQAQKYKASEAVGKATRMNWRDAERRADDLRERKRARLAELEQERHITAGSPHVEGQMVVVPMGVLRKLGLAEPLSRRELVDVAAKRAVEAAAMQTVMAAERALGRQPHDVSAENRGYDVESRDPISGDLVFLEVKGRAADADSITLTRNEILAAKNLGERFRLVIVLVDKGGPHPPVYVTGFDGGSIPFALTQAAYKLRELLAMGTGPL